MLISSIKLSGTYLWGKNDKLRALLDHYFKEYTNYWRWIFWALSVLPICALFDLFSKNCALLSYGRFNYST